MTSVQIHQKEMGPCFRLVWIRRFSHECRALDLPHGWEKIPFSWILCYGHWNCTKLVALFWFVKWSHRFLPALLWDTALIWDLFELWLCCASQVWVEPDGVAVQRLWSPADNPLSVKDCRVFLWALPPRDRLTLVFISCITIIFFSNISLLPPPQFVFYPNVWAEPTPRCAFWYFLILLGRRRSLSHAARLIAVGVSCNTLLPNVVWAFE